MCRPGVGGGGDAGRRGRFTCTLRGWWEGGRDTHTDPYHAALQQLVNFALSANQRCSGLSHVHVRARVGGQQAALGLNINTAAYKPPPLHYYHYYAPP